MAMGEFLRVARNEQRKSMAHMAREMGFNNHHVLKRIFESYKLPTLTQYEAAVRIMYQLNQETEFRERSAKATREELYRRWQDPKFIEKQAKAARRSILQLKQNPEFRERGAEATRRTRLNPSNIDKYRLPTIQGYRNDIGFYAQSTWEANFARILIYCAKQFQNREKFSPREFYTRENLRLQVTEEFKHLFDSKEIEKSIDFVVKNMKELLGYLRSL